MAGKGKFTFIDLFAGCGGLSEGFCRKGFQALAAVNGRKSDAIVYHGLTRADA